MTDLDKWLADNRVENATRNAGTLRRIAAHLRHSGRSDPSGNTARTFEAAAERCDRIAQGS